MKRNGGIGTVSLLGVCDLRLVLSGLRWMNLLGWVLSCGRACPAISHVPVLSPTVTGWLGWDESLITHPGSLARVLLIPLLHLGGLIRE